MHLPQYAQHTVTSLWITSTFYIVTPQLVGRIAPLSNPLRSWPCLILTCKIWVSNEIAEPEGGKDPRKDRVHPADPASDVTHQARDMISRDISGKVTFF